MKNKMIKGFMMTGMACMLLTACSNKEQADTTQNADTVITTETTQTADTTGTTEDETKTEPVAEIKEESTPTAEAVTLTDEDMVVLSLDDTTAMLQSYFGEAESIIIPEEINGRKITVIGEEAFANETQLKSIVIPDTVTEIQRFAFINCDNLDYVAMSKNIETIGERAFLGPNYYEIDLPDTLKELGDAAFSNCKFSELVIPESIKVITKGSFYSCKQLRTVVIEEGVEVIGKEAFSQCEMLESITIPSSVTEIENPFRGSENVTIYTPAGSYAETWAAENGVPCVTQ